MMSMETVLALHAVDGVSLTYCIILGKTLKLSLKLMEEITFN